MMQAALPDAAAPAPEGQDANDLISESAAEGLRSLHEKIEDAFAASEDRPSQVVVLPFRAAAERQAAAIGEMDARLERLENGAELAELRETMREMCAVIAGLAAQSERGANVRDEKISDLAHALESQLGADRDRLNALEIRVVDSEAGNARHLENMRAVLGQLEERMRVGEAHNEDLAYNMRVLRGELAGLGEAAAAIRRLEERADAGDARHAELSRVSDVVASAARRLEEKFAAADRRQEDLLRDMDRVKGETLAETAAAMRAHRGRMDEAERLIGEMKDRNARAAERLEALTDGLGSMGRKLDSGTERLAALAGDVIKLHGRIERDVSGAQLLAERLGTIESWIAKAHERERARAELHARLADSLLPPA